MCRVTIVLLLFYFCTSDCKFTNVYLLVVTTVHIIIINLIKVIIMFVIITGSKNCTLLNP